MSSENQTPSAAEDRQDAVNKDDREQDLQQIREALRGLRYGSVSIIIQDGVVVQIDRTEKKRVRRNGN